tara:strand:- start:152 stop:292 length:141 start_codon:yes stop_codon:yes gene_type:complete
MEEEMVQCDNCNEYIDEDAEILNYSAYFCTDKCAKEYWLLADHPKG